MINWPSEEQQKEYERLRTSFKHGDPVVVSTLPHAMWTMAQASVLQELRQALAVLADPESWQGDYKNQGATLLGHLTPYELARQALEIDSPEDDHPPVKAKQW